MQISGWGSRTPFSKASGISRAGISSYGFCPYVNISHRVTPLQLHCTSALTVKFNYITLLILISTKWNNVEVKILEIHVALLKYFIGYAVLKYNPGAVVKERIYNDMLSVIITCSDARVDYLIVTKLFWTYYIKLFLKQKTLKKKLISIFNKTS